MMPERIDESTKRALIRSEGKSLSRLGVAEPCTYIIDERQFFGEPEKRIDTAVQAWYRSLSLLVTMLGPGDLKSLHEWILEKKKTFESALNNKFSLHFDVLVLGIVSTTLRLYVTLG